MFETYDIDERDLWVDFDNFEKIGEPDVLFAEAKRQVGYDEIDFDNFLDNLNE
ncbi:MAG: hypothetical protein K2H44_10045 [Muribaculaceae bacterium]|nr:hypothetical protein [Muribaculaceae bacterium]